MNPPDDRLTVVESVGTKIWAKQQQEDDVRTRQSRQSNDDGNRHPLTAEKS